MSYVLTARCQCGALIATGPTARTRPARLWAEDQRFMMDKAQRLSRATWTCCPGSPSMRIQYEEI